MSTFEKVQELVAKQLNRKPEEFMPETNLIEAGFESLDVIELIFALEEEFDISIEYNANDAEADSLTTLAGIVAAVDAQVAKKLQGK